MSRAGDERARARAAPRPASPARTGAPRQLPRWARDAGVALGIVAWWWAARWLLAYPASFLGREVAPPDTFGAFLDRVLLHGEAEWHLAIARGGYAYIPGGASPAGYPPLLGLLLTPAAHLTRYLPLAGAAFVFLALAAALVYLLALARLDYDEGTARRAVAAALLWPAAPFLGVVAPDALLLLTVGAALYHARCRQWPLAALWGALAGLARGFGLLVLIPLLIEWWQARREGRAGRRDLAALAAIPLPFVAWLLWLDWRTGVAGAFFHAQVAEGRGALFDPRGVATLASALAALAGDGTIALGYPDSSAFARPFLPALLDLGFLALGLAAGWWLLARTRRSYGCFVLAGVVASVFIGGLPGTPRRLLLCAPLFLALALAARRPVVGYLLGILGLLLQALTFYLYVNGFFAG